jgi:hypothetical protein
MLNAPVIAQSLRRRYFLVIKKLIAAGTGIVAAVLSTLPVHACSNCGCGLSGIGKIALGFGWPAVACQFAPLTSLYGLGMMLPSWGWGWW